MNITQEDTKTLKAIVNRYAEIHIVISNLEKEMLTLVDRKNVISEELNTLRESEVSLINKIEEDTGSKMTQEILTEIVNS
jgi:hypothetical protein